jgi:diadenosine tetraphosphate (Ap4A) HIT family hydrolase
VEELIMASQDCAHCLGLDEHRLWEGAQHRIVLVDDTGFEGWCRIIWNDHVSELTDLSGEDRQTLFTALLALEEAMRAELQPWKINIASLGTGAPHLHFHVVPRFQDDPTFPDPVWLPPQRQSGRTLPDGFVERMVQRLAQSLGATAA